MESNSVYKDCLERKGASVASERFNMAIVMGNKTASTAEITFRSGDEEEEEVYQLLQGRKVRLRKQVEQSPVRISAASISGADLLINGELSVTVAITIDYDTVYIVSDEAISSCSQDGNSESDNDDMDRDSEKDDEEGDRDATHKKPRRHCRTDVLYDNLSKNYLPSTSSRRKRN
eukprot:Seg1104.2 transcript_id=Seg1104.2/GoldUCD/mRNA.D3Y31 product="hypothetical protein" protein_id=Seg1104.2/GoldUCD/D3Y31